MREGEVPVAVEDEITAHLGYVHLLRTPDLAAEDESNVAPDHARRSHGGETFAPRTQPRVADTLRIREPDIGMAEVCRETFQLGGTGERDHRNTAIRPGDLLVVPPQLREMFLAEESTQVAEQDQNRGTPQQPAGREDFAVDGQEVESEIDPHQAIMQSVAAGTVIGITVAHVGELTIGS